MIRTVVPDAALAIARDAGERVPGGDLLREKLKLNERLAGKVHDIDVADPQPTRLSDITVPQPLAETGKHRRGEPNLKRLIGSQLLLYQLRVERPGFTNGEPDRRGIPRNIRVLQS